MKKSHKIGFSFLAFTAIILLLLFVTGIIAKQKIKEYAGENLKDVLAYEELDVKIFRRRITLKAPEITLKNGSVEAREILLNGLSYYRLLSDNKIILENVEIREPKIILKQIPEDSPEPEEASENSFRQDVLIKSFRILDGTVRRMGGPSSDENLYLSLKSFYIDDLAVDSSTVKNNVPFNYSGYGFEGDSLKMLFDGQHDLSIGSFSSDKNNLELRELRIIPKYDKIEFQKHIPYEKDRFVVFINRVAVDDFSYDLENDDPELRSSLIRVSGADLEVYRNKLMPPDPRRKPLYSEKIRKMPIRINFSKIEVEGSKIVYEEKMQETRPPGVVSFSDVNAKIENMTNMDLAIEDFPKTVVNATALFLSNTPVELDWEFDISNELESFTISGSFGRISGEAINAFIRPALNVEARGGFESLAFNYAGNDDKAVGDVRIKYEDFKVSVLKDDGEQKSSFWSALANLFINNDAVNEDLTHEDLEVTRDKNKSFWNYLWLCVREGALSSFL